MGVEDAKRALTAVGEAVRGILRGVEPLTAYELAFIEDAANDARRDHCLSYGARILAGDHPHGRHEAGAAPMRLFTGTVYVKLSEQRWAVTSPFLTLDRGEGGAVGELAIIDRLSAGTERIPVHRYFTRSGEVSDPLATDHYAAVVGAA